MSDSNEENPKPQELRKLNVIKKLKFYKDKAKIALLIREYNKKQESDYFLEQNNIKLGKITSYKGKKNRSPYSFVGPNSLFSPGGTKRKQTISHQNSLMRFKYSSSLSTSKIEKRYKENTNVNKNNVIDNKSLKNYYNDIRQRLRDKKSKNEDRNKLLIELPYEVRKSLINQENIFKKIMKEKKLKKMMEKKIIKKCKKNKTSDLLINQNKKFDKKNQEYSIIDKNMTNEYRYKGNLWNITLRNFTENGKYDYLGYLNVGNKYQPKYTLFEINKNIDYFYNPKTERNRTIENKKRRNKLFNNINENNYNLKMKQNLQVLNNIKNIEINGKNLLEVEDKRESQIKGKKIIYNKQELDYLMFKNKSRNEINHDREMKAILDDIYEEKYFAINYKTNDFFKNANITSRYTSTMSI